MGPGARFRAVIVPHSPTWTARAANCALWDARLQLLAAPPNTEQNGGQQDEKF